jgi:hypothetical protein
LTNASSLYIFAARICTGNYANFFIVLKKAQTFRLLFPEYKNLNIYLGLAGLHVYKNAEKEALKHGIAVIKQFGKNMVIHDENLRTF